MNTKLHITRRSGDWHCQLEKKPETWSCGKSPAEAIGNWVIDHGKEHGVHAAMVPTQQQLLELARLERAVYDAGIDGGEATSAAIDELQSAEWGYGVFDPNAEPLTREVELGPEDVPINSLLRPVPGFGFDKDQKGEWAMVINVDVKYGCVLAVFDHSSNPRLRAISWLEMVQQAEINRPRHRDADGNPTKWEACSKTITTP